MFVNKSKPLSLALTIIGNYKMIITVCSLAGEPSLTLWVGTKGGRVCVYIIKTNQHSRQRKIELLPTGNYNWFNRFSFVQY